jgi:ribonuclease HII
MGKIQKLLEDWSTGEFVAGLDEVGRGCGAGPVVTAAVIMPKGFKSPLIRDSKKLSEKQRNEAFELIQKNAISISCNAGSVTDIDALGINPTTFKTMHKCIDDLVIRPDYLLIDGNVWEPYKGKYSEGLAIELVTKGDDTYTCIAAAAIIAKVRRDEYMVKLNDLYPQYNWASNKGYLTPDHLAALKLHGSNRYHRREYVKNHIPKVCKYCVENKI